MIKGDLSEQTLQMIMIDLSLTKSVSESKTKPYLVVRVFLQQFCTQFCTLLVFMPSEVAICQKEWIHLRSMSICNCYFLNIYFSRHLLCHRPDYSICFRCTKEFLWRTILLTSTMERIATINTSHQMPPVSFS